MQSPQAEAQSHSSTLSADTLNSVGHLEQCQSWRHTLPRGPARSDQCTGDLLFLTLSQDPLEECVFNTNTVRLRRGGLSSRPSYSIVLNASLRENLDSSPTSIHTSRVQYLESFATQSSWDTVHRKCRGVHDLSLSFLQTKRRLLRMQRDGSTYLWTVDEEDFMPTLEETFSDVHPALGFNIEIKFPGNDPSEFDADAETERILSAVLPVGAVTPFVRHFSAFLKARWSPRQPRLSSSTRKPRGMLRTFQCCSVCLVSQVVRIIGPSLQVVARSRGNRPVFFSSFVPQAVIALKQKQAEHHVSGYRS